MIQRSLVAILLSITGLFILIKINLDIAHVYQMAHEKTRAVFGLLELSFFYRYFAGTFGFVALVLSALAYWKKEKRLWVTMAIGLSLLAFLGSFLKIWKLMV
jgi:heme A synthase